MTSAMTAAVIFVFVVSVLSGMPEPSSMCGLGECVKTSSELSLIQVQASAKKMAMDKPSGFQLEEETSVACDHGICKFYGDRYIYGFDQPSENASSLMQVDAMYPQNYSFARGYHWLVKSELVQVQGKFAKVNYPKANQNRHNGQVYMIALAVGGPFLHGHTLIIEPRSGKVMWNRREILVSLPSAFQFQSDSGNLIQASYDNDTALVHKPELRTSRLDIKLPSDVKLTVNRFKHHLGIILAMPRSAGGQHGMDGLCGNFNCDADDDTAMLIEKRMDPRVAENDRLFLGEGHGKARRS